MHLPGISVAITTHNRPDYLSFALDSIQKQTLRPDHVVVSEDGSNPLTKAVIDRFKGMGMSIEHVSNSPPLMQLDNRRQAMSLTRGEFVAMLDDDDLWEPTFLERASVALSGHPECDFCSTDHYIIDEFGALLTEDTETAARLFGRSQLAGGMINDVLCRHLSTKPFALGVTLFRRKALERVGFFPLFSGTVPDFGLFSMLGASRCNAYYISERLGSYRIHTGQQTRSRSQNAESMVKFILEFKELFNLSAKEYMLLGNLYRESIIELAISYCHEYRRRRAIEVLLDYSVLGSGTHPWRRMGVLVLLLAGARKLKRARPAR